MEDVYPRVAHTDTRELYLREVGRSRVAYIPWDIDRTFWEVLSPDHGRLLRNVVTWALDEPPVVEVEGPGLLDVTVWRQRDVDDGAPRQPDQPDDDEGAAARDHSHRPAARSAAAAERSVGAEGPAADRGRHAGREDRLTAR